MNIFTHIKHKYALLKLKALLPDSRSPIVCNLKKAKSVGIIYEAKTKTDVIIIKKFVAFLKEYVEELVSLGYYDSNTLEDWHLQPSSSYFFCKKDLNWYFKPIDSSILQFTDKEFDILINFTNCDKIPCNFVNQMSVARLKVGKYCESNENLYDLSVKVNDEFSSEEENLNNLIEQMKYYLLLIKPS